MGEGLRVLAIVAIAVLLRWCVAYHPYSGQGDSPMYGDYEAQRHWQEITLNLPTQSWYTNGSDNDLQYWGLDYPPLTAYHSLVLARLARRMNPAYVKLGKSRGYESVDHKYFMRLSVVAADLLVYVPALMYFARKVTSREGRPRADNVFGLSKDDAVLFTALLYPGLILVDHGHFQYNCVSLGLFVAAVAALLRNFVVASSLLFVLALNYKQMELYHAPPFFFYILGNNTPGGRKNLLSCLRSLICVSLTVVVTFVLVWAPFVQNWQVFVDVATRLFPLERGVFEDKVSNFWCALNVFYKLRASLTNAQMARLCLIATSLAVLPSCSNLYAKPNKEKFVLSLVNCSLGFYLFSFQVHEKSILLVAIPVLMYLHRDPFPSFWFLILSTFSLLPLMIKDNLVIAYFSLSTLYPIAVYLMWRGDVANLTIRENKDNLGKIKTKINAQTCQRKFRVKQTGRSRNCDARAWPHRLYDKIQHFLLGREILTSMISSYSSSLKIMTFCVSVLGVFVISVASILVKPPQTYPDLFALLVSLYSCLHFVAFFLYFNYKQIYGLQKHSGKSKSH